MASGRSSSASCTRSSASPPTGGGVRQQRTGLGQRRAPRRGHRDVGPGGPAHPWLQPLLDGELRSAFSMTEPNTAGSDPTLLSTRAVLDGEEYVINGHQVYTSNGSVADFLVVMAVTNPDVTLPGLVDVHRPVDTPGSTIVRDVPSMEDPAPTSGSSATMPNPYTDVRVPPPTSSQRGSRIPAGPGPPRPGRIHHCMRWLGQSRRAFDMPV